MTESVAGVAVAPSVPLARIVHAISIQLICRALGMLASVVSVAMTARYLGPGRYGQLTIAVVFIGMWISLADLGIAAVIVRRVTSGRGELDRLVRVNSGLALVYCVPLAALAAGSGLLIYRDSAVRVMLVVLSAGLFMLTMTTTVRAGVSYHRPVPGGGHLRRRRPAGDANHGRLPGSGAGGRHLVRCRATHPTCPAAADPGHRGGTAHLGAPDLRAAGGRRSAAGKPAADGHYVGRDRVLARGRRNPVLGEYSFRGRRLRVGPHDRDEHHVVAMMFLKSTLSTATELFSRDVAAFAGFMRRSVELMLFVAVPVGVVGALLAGPLDRVLRRPGVRVPRDADAGVVIHREQRCGSSPPPSAKVCSPATSSVSCCGCSSSRLVLNIALNLTLDSRLGAVGAGVALVCTEFFGTVMASRWLHRECGYRTPVMFLMRVVVRRRQVWRWRCCCQGST